MNQLFDLSGKVAVVTGGSRGLGLAIAQGLAMAGAHVVVVSRYAPAPAQAFEHSFVECDLTDASARQGLIERTVAEQDRIDILFHCAGQQARHPAEQFPLEEWNAILELHLTAAMDLSQQAARFMLDQGSGKVVLMSSILAFQGGLTIPAYCAAKHGVSGLVKALSNEWASRGINVNALAPGYFEAGVGQDVLQDAVRGPQILSRIPAGRAGRAEELAGAAIFLASVASSYMHGQTLVIDGGWLGR